MFKFVEKLFGFDSGRIEYLESKCLEQSELIRNLAEGFKEQTLLLQKISERKQDIDYDRIDIDYYDLANKINLKAVASGVGLKYLAEEIDLGELANNISLDDLSSYFNVDEVAANLDLNEDDFVDTIAEKVLEKLVNKYRAKAE